MKIAHVLRNHRNVRAEIGRQVKHLIQHTMKDFKLRGDETLAELRTINARLNSERTAMSHALTREKTERINQFNELAEKFLLEYEGKKTELVDAYNAVKIELDNKFCKFGVEVGYAKDKRRLAETNEDVESWDDRINYCMSERHRIKVQKAELLSKLHKDLHELKSAFVKLKRETAAQRDMEMQLFRPRFQANNEYFDAAVEITRQAIAKIIKTESDYHSS